MPEAISLFINNLWLSRAPRACDFFTFGVRIPPALHAECWAKSLMWIFRFL
jgi:hypothetical protein